MDTKPKNSMVNAIITAVIMIVLLPIIIINTVMIVKSYTDPNHLPSVFGIKPAIILSGSMHPVFDPDALVFIKTGNADNLVDGDIICFLQDGAAITHRIVAVTQTDGQTTYITKGDANNTADEAPVLASQVEGVYIGHIAGLGGVAMFMQTPTGMMICIGIPILLYLLVDMLIRRKERKAAANSAAALERELAELKAQHAK